MAVVIVAGEEAAGRRELDACPPVRPVLRSERRPELRWTKGARISTNQRESFLAKATERGAAAGPVAKKLQRV